MEKFLQSEPLCSEKLLQASKERVNPWSKFVVPLRIKGGPGLTVEDIARKCSNFNRSISFGIGSMTSMDTSCGDVSPLPLPSESTEDALCFLKSAPTSYVLTPPASPDSKDVNTFTVRIPARRDNIKKSSIKTKCSNTVKTKSKASDALENSKKRIHKCTYADCRKVYTKSSHLKAHQRTHTGKQRLAWA